MGFICWPFEGLNRPGNSPEHQSHRWGEMGGEKREKRPNQLNYNVVLLAIFDTSAAEIQIARGTFRGKITAIWRQFRLRLINQFRLPANLTKSGRNAGAAKRAESARITDTFSNCFSIFGVGYCLPPCLGEERACGIATAPPPLPFPLPSSPLPVLSITSSRTVSESEQEAASEGKHREASKGARTGQLYKGAGLSCLCRSKLFLSSQPLYIYIITLQITERATPSARWGNYRISRDRKQTSRDFGSENIRRKARFDIHNDIKNTSLWTLTKMEMTKRWTFFLCPKYGARTNVRGQNVM